MNGVNSVRLWLKVSCAPTLSDIIILRGSAVAIVKEVEKIQKVEEEIEIIKSDKITVCKSVYAISNEEESGIQDQVQLESSHVQRPSFGINLYSDPSSLSPPIQDI